MYTELAGEALEGLIPGFLVREADGTITVAFSIGGLENTHFSLYCSLAHTIVNLSHRFSLDFPARVPHWSGLAEFPAQALHPSSSLLSSGTLSSCPVLSVSPARLLLFPGISFAILPTAFPL